MLDFDPYKSRMILTTPDANRDICFRVLELAVEHSCFDKPVVNAKLELERFNQKGTQLVFAPKFPSVAQMLGKLKARRGVFNPPATVVLWEDGSKTVVKCDKDDEYNVMTGIALCYMKKALGNTSRELNKALNNAKSYIEEEKR